MPASPDPVLATVVDSQGRSIILTRERWAHITDGHPELMPYQADILNALRSPTRQAPGRRPEEEWFYLDGAGPSRWLKVVVVYGQAGGFVVTAFPRRRLP